MKTLEQNSLKLPKTKEAMEIKAIKAKAMSEIKKAIQDTKKGVFLF